MLFWIIRITLISIILIFLVHHLINFFKTTLTVPKIKDLVNTSTQKYENIFSIIKQNSNTNNTNNNTNTNNTNNTNFSNNYTSIDLLPKPDEPNMKNELKSFLKKQLNNGTDISSLDTITGSNSYSTFYTF
jgi:hypothetical protein